MRHLHTPHREPGRPPRGGFNFGPVFDRESGPAFGPGFGPGFGPDRPRGRRRGGRGGDVRAAVLLLLADGPRHGYQLIQEIGERSSGAWTPSPGSVYPVLQQLEDEGLVTIQPVDGRKTASLTDEGTTYVSEHREELDQSWAAATSGGPASFSKETGQVLHGLVMAWREVARTGTPEQQLRANEILDASRKSLYRLLAGDDTER